MNLRGMKTETLIILDRLIRKQFDESEWMYTQQWIDLAEDLNRKELADEMRKDITYVI